MNSRYSVLQYTPDPVTGERVNIGVVAWDQERAVCRCTNNWRRLRPILGENLAFVRGFAADLETRAKGWSPDVEADFFDALVTKFLGNWTSSIQITEPRGSIKGAAATVANVAPIFLSILTHEREHRRTRSTAVSMAVQALRRAVTTRISQEASEKAVVLRPIVNGALEHHTIDVAVRNGKILSGVHALSFETADPNRLEKDVEATAWIVDDIHKSDAALRISVFALPPTEATRDAYARADRIFKAMRVPLIAEGDLGNWAARQADELAQHIGRLDLPATN